MNDVREQVRQVVLDSLKARQGGDSSAIADAILERFDVTPKPAVTAREMGGIMRGAYLHSGVTDGGQYALDELARRGLKIVRVSDE